MEKMDIFDATILHHVCIVLLLLWSLSFFNFRHPVVYLISLVYLYLVHELYVMRLRRNIRFEERKRSNQRRALSDSETVRWLNHTVEKMWPACMEQIVSQKILFPIIPWFLEKYKPWVASEAVVEHLYMGRSPPMFTEMRVLPQTTEDDHLVLELGMIFRTANDMNAILAVKLRKELGFGIWAKMHLTGMHVEGKVLVGVKFLRQWPYLGRLRVCFVEPPHFQMNAKPIFNHGIDVTELPGISGWLDKLLAVAFEQTLVEPNMLVVDMEKFVSPQPVSESWFSVYEKGPVAYALVEIIEAADMKPSDLNGLADPYVKVQLGPHKYKTGIQKKTLNPKWQEEFKFPISTWKVPNVLVLEVGDKDPFLDDSLGGCSIIIDDFRGGQRQDIWLPLEKIKMGRLHLAITVEESQKRSDQPCDAEALNGDDERNSAVKGTAPEGSLSFKSKKPPRVPDEFEPINIEGQKETGIWAHHPGSEVSPIWEPRKGRGRLNDVEIKKEGGDRTGSFKSSASGSCNNDDNSTDESQEGYKGNSQNKVIRALQKIGSIFQRNSKKDNSSRVKEPVPSPGINFKEVNAKDVAVEDNPSAPSPVEIPKAEVTESPEGSDEASPHKRDLKGKVKSIAKQAGKSAHDLKHAFSRKGSKREQGDSGAVVTEREISLTSKSSDEESFCTSEGTPVISKSISSCGDESFKPKELTEQKTPSDLTVKALEPINIVNLEGPEKIGDHSSIIEENSEENSNTLVKEIPKTQLPEKNLEVSAGNSDV